MNNKDSMLPVLFYISACFFAIFANTLGQYFCANTNLTVMNLFLHVDIINLIISSSIIFVISVKSRSSYLNIETFTKHKRQIFLFSFPVIASLFKTFLLGFVPATNMAISSFLTPFIVAILALILLKESLPREYFLFAFLACCGFYVANSSKIDFKMDHNIKWILSYVFINSLSVIIIRFFAMKRRFFEAVFIENLIYAMYGILLFCTTQKFSTKVLFSHQALLCSGLAFMHHLFIILAYKNASKIANIQLLDFSKIIFAMIITYALFGVTPTYYMVIGSIIIFIAVYKANIKIPRKL